MFWKTSKPTPTPPDANQAAADNQALAAALAHFKAAQAAASEGARGVLVGADAQGRVVRIEHGSSRPPRRCWYRVGPGGTVQGELTLEQAAPYGETAWR